MTEVKDDGGERVCAERKSSTLPAPRYSRKNKCSRDYEWPEVFFEVLLLCTALGYLVRGILGNSSTEVWSLIVQKISGGTFEKRSLFCLRYAFHAATYAI